MQSWKIFLHLNQAIFFVHFSEGQLIPMACGASSFEGKNVSFESKNTSFCLIISVGVTGNFFVHFSEGQLRPVACSALSFEGKNVSFLGKKYQFLSYKEFFQFSSKKGLRYFEF